MASLSLDIPVEKPKALSAIPDAERRQEELLLVAGFGNPLAADYAAHVSLPSGGGAARRLRLADLSEPAANAHLHSTVGNPRVAALGLFLSPRLTEPERGAGGGLLKL